MVWLQVITLSNYYFLLSRMLKPGDYCACCDRRCHRRICRSPEARSSQLDDGRSDPRHHDQHDHHGRPKNRVFFIKKLFMMSRDISILSLDLRSVVLNRLRFTQTLKKSLSSH
jgi:hypothetical protein